MKNMKNFENAPLKADGAYVEDAFQNATIDELAQAAQLASWLAKKPIGSEPESAPSSHSRAAT